MSEKKQKESKPWECNHGCDLSKGEACKHLNDLVRDKNNEIIYKNKKKEPEFESTNQRIGKDVEKLYYTSGAGFVIPEGIKSGKYEQQFRSKLRKAGIGRLQIDILVLTFIYENTTKEISEELGIPTLMKVVRLRTDALNNLKRKWDK